MQLTGQCLIESPRARVWQALNDVEVLRQCIPGCESITKDSDHVARAEIRMRIGPVKARFKTDLTISALDPPSSYLIAGKGSSGAAGFASGQAKITLQDKGANTVLCYQAEITIGGRLAQTGNRMINRVSQNFSDSFFTSLSELLASQHSG